MKRLLGCAAVTAFLFLGCEGPQPSAPEPSSSQGSSSESARTQTTPPPAQTATVEMEAAATPAGISAGAKAIQTYQCTRCHTISGVEPTTLEFDCAGCHKRMKAGEALLGSEKQALYQERLSSLLHVPALTAMGRFRRDWVQAFVKDAYDLRPNLGPSMPRFRMSTSDATAIAAFLVPEAEHKAPPPGDAQAGREAMEARGCMSCHRFTGVPAIAAAPVPSITPSEHELAKKRAPDLRFARERMRPAVLAKWIQHPREVKPGTTMPELGLSAEESRDIATYLLSAQLKEMTYVPMPERLPLLTQEVTYAQVNERVFGALCRHCHSDPSLVIGDGGPGYDGGFGFPKRALDLSTYAGIRSGALDDNGKRRSIFKKDRRGDPKLIAHLWARHSEVAGKPIEGTRGMPLGLPPLPPKDIQLIETWIAQGRKRG